MFQLKNKNLNYGDKAVLRGINLDIRSGEVVALVGESGCGKSTLLSHLRALKPKEVAWCPQEACLVPALSAFHNIYAGRLDTNSFLSNLRNLISPSQRELERVEAVAQKLALADELKLSVDQLSGGQQQRVNIARAMIQHRSIFLGDEPVSAIDEYQGPNIVRAIIEQHTTCVFALHDLDLALSCCHRIVGLANGRILFDRQVGDIKAEQLSQIYSHHPKPKLDINKSRQTQ